MTNEATQEGYELPHAAILLAVQRVTRSRTFSGSPRLCRFLTWTVNQTLSGGGENIKQYSIGQEVFDRGTDFDPKVDSIVRTEAQRLRRKLRDYYAAEGSVDPVEICLSPGSYVPIFRQRHTMPVGEQQDKPALAVLRFENLTGNAGLDYFCRGVTESIQGRLASVRGLKVVAVMSSFAISSQEDLAVTASRLGVGTIVQGGIRQANERIRVHANAITPAAGTYIWTGTFDRDLKDVFAVEDEIASSIATSLSRKILQPQGWATAPGSAVQAYDLYLQGQHAWAKLTPAAYSKAADCFTRAILACPDCAQAYAALAEVYFWMVAFSQRPANELVEAADRAAVQAIQLDANCAEAYVVLGSLASVFEWKWDEAERLFQTGLEIRPSYAQAYIQRAFARMQLGQFEASRADIDNAAELDPLSPRAHRASALLAYVQRDYPCAIDAVERALELGSELRHTFYLAGRIFLQAGDVDRAIQLLLRSVGGSAPALYQGVLVAAYATAGRKAEARAVLQTLQQQATKTFVSPVAFIHAYAGLGEVAQALDWLDRAADDRYTGLIYLKFDPLFDSIRHDERFGAILTRMNLL